MNRIFKNGYAVALATLALAFTACTDEYEYDPAAPETGAAGAYISADETTFIFTQDEEPIITFTVERHDTEEAKSYKLFYTSDDPDVSIKDFPTEVSFAAGEESKTLPVNLTLPAGTIGKEIVIGVNDEDAYVYGSKSMTFTVSVCRRVPGAMFYTRFIGDGTHGSLWDAIIYEYGKTTSQRTDTEGNPVTITKSTFYLKDPYNLQATDEDGNPLYNEDGTPQTIFGDNGVGYGLTFTISSSSHRAELGSNPTQFYADETVTGDPAYTGTIIPSGDGTYYPEGEQVMLEPGVTAENVVVFSWMLLIGDTGAGYNGVPHAILFPKGYDVIDQSGLPVQGEE